MTKRKVILTQELLGSDIVRALWAIAKEHGMCLDYLPITIAYANIGSSEKKIFYNIRILSENATLAISSPERDGAINSESRYRELFLDIPDESIDIFSSLVEDLSAKIVDYSAQPSSMYKPETQVERIDTYTAPPPRDYSMGFRVLVVWQGEYGERIFRNLEKRAPPHWQVNALELSRDLPMIIDDPSEYIPEEIPETDLLLFLSESQNSPQLVPELVRRSRARGLIAPIDNSEWMPFGQVSQISKIMDQWHVEYAFPRPFCSLDLVGKETIDEFARWFGKPIIEIETEDNKTASNIKVIRGTPCGNTHYLAENVRGVRLDEIVEKAALTHHHYPCLASMKIEPDLNDTLMHASGFITKNVFEEQVKKYIKRNVGYLDPSQFR
ncbi:MAG: DUF166 family protein [Methanomassiliicoccales archaeon]|jgi:hypothetical protein|nr:DUF166 family protein [Methanomassiliicoccales archaeon]